MQTLQTLKRKIASAEDLQSVVKTMKAIAAVNIRQYEEAVEALSQYRRTLELGLQVVMQRRPEGVHVEAGSPGGRWAVIAFGSEQGLCGQFNDTIERYVMERLGWDRDEEKGEPAVAVMGDRLMARMERSPTPVARTFRIPSSMAGIRQVVGETLILIERWREEEGVGTVDLMYNRPRSGAAYDPVTLRVFPIDTEWLLELAGRPWGERTVPALMMPWRRLFTALVRETIAVSLHRAFSESLAAENSSRLASMQAAEQNIDDHLESLQHRFHQQRQRSTTEELLDIISGFEALRKEEGAAAG